MTPNTRTLKGQSYCSQRWANPVWPKGSKSRGFSRNKELLNWRKIGFLASRKISTSAILPTLDWAVETSKRTDVAVVSGFHSCLEKDVLKFLLQGKCGIIIVLARGIYRKLPKIYDTVMEENRLLIISLEKETVTRVSEHTAHKRNKYVEKLADELRQIHSL